MMIHGVVVLYYPNEKVKDNIKTYIDDLDLLYVVDNTPDADNSVLFSFDPKIRYFALKENKGIAAALNIGAREGIKNGASWLLTMDQDSRFDNDGFKMMKDFLSDFMKDEKVKKEVENSLEQTAIISPYHRMSINADRKVSGISKPTVVMTSGNLVNLNAFEKVGGFKEWLYIDGVDFDFCMECRKKGFEIIRLNQVELKHDLGNITVHKFFKRKVYTDNHSAIRRYYIIRNRHYLFDMHSDAFLPSCKGELSQTKYEVLRIILYEKDKIRKLKYMFKGYRDYKKGKKGPLCI